MPFMESSHALHVKSMDGLLSEITIDQSPQDDIFQFNHLKNSKSQESIWHRCLHPLKKCYMKLGLKHLLPVLLLALYSVIGAGAFYALESSHELNTLAKNQQLLDSARRQIAERVWELKLENLTRRRVILHAMEALKWYDDNTKGLDTIERQWDFWGAIFYCGTIYTTIGYGNFVPGTFGGKLLTLFYAAFGIPLVLFILNDLGDVLGKKIYFIWEKLKGICHRGKKSRCPSDDNLSLKSAAAGSAELASVHDLPMSIALGITLGWMFLCSAVFCAWEDWDYFQAFHFFFVSLTTVGLGDTVPKHRNYMIMSFGLILLGLSLVSMCIHVVQAKVEHLAQQMLEKLMKKYQIAQLDDIGSDVDHSPTEELIERTLHQTAAPPWVRALLSKNTKAKLMKEWKTKRAKLKVASTQTDMANGSKVTNVGCQTDFEPDWRTVYEEKLNMAHDLLKELEQRYGVILKDQQIGKCKMQSIKKHAKLTDPVDETINAIKMAMAKVPTGRRTSLKDRLPFIIKRRQTMDATGEYILTDSIPEHVPANGQSAPVSTDSAMDTPSDPEITLTTETQTNPLAICPLDHPKSVTIVECEEVIHHPNPSVIAKWIRRLAPKPRISRGSQTLANEQPICYLCLCKCHQNPTDAEPAPEVSIGCQTVLTGVDFFVRIDSVEAMENIAIMQTGEYDNERFISIPYALDDCKILFNAIHRKLGECQSLLSDYVRDNDAL